MSHHPQSNSFSIFAMATTLPQSPILCALFLSLLRLSNGHRAWWPPGGRSGATLLQLDFNFTERNSDVHDNAYQIPSLRAR